MKVVILDRAKSDLLEGIRFYESQKEGLGGYFLQTLFEDIDALAEQAGIHECEFGYHRSLAKVFPFAIYYLVDASLVSVYAVLDCRLDPRSTRDRLS
jgi:hypothetical protein